jgi:hypothetical protein
VRTYLFAKPTCNFPRHATAGFHPRSHGAGLAGARRSVPYASQRSTHAHVHARRHARRGEGAASRGSAREWRPSAARQYLSFTSAPRRGDFREARRYSQVHELAAFSAHRLGRLPDILTAGPPHHVRGLRRVQELYGPDLSALESGAQHRDPKIHRRRHHDGARSMRALDCRAFGRARCDETHAPLGAAQPRCARRLAASPFRYRAGRAFHGLTRRERACHRAAAIRRVRHRRSRGRRIRGGARGLHGEGERVAAGGQTAVSDGRRHDARSARGCASRRRHVRLHLADGARQARRGVHQHRSARPPARGLSRHGRPDRPGLQVSYLRSATCSMPATAMANRHGTSPTRNAAWPR